MGRVMQGAEGSTTLICARYTEKFYVRSTQALYEGRLD